MRASVPTPDPAAAQSAAAASPAASARTGGSASHGLCARRPMTLTDLGEVMAIEAQAYSHPWSQGNFIDSLAAGHLAEVLLQERRLIGYLVAMPGVDELHLLNVTVAPMHQSQGHGSVLLAAVLAHARERSLATVWLEVRASNGRARALYARRGYVEMGVRRGYYPARLGREDAVVMRRDVSPLPTSAEATANDAQASGGADALD